MNIEKQNKMFYIEQKRSNMARSINEDKLCTAFYQSMDFLNFDQKKYQRFLKSLVINNISGWSTLQDAVANNSQDNFSNILNEYAFFCKYEYNQWINSLKFQVDSGSLKKIVPPSSRLNSFFEDVHLRIPHENTLIIDYGVENLATAIVNATQTPIQTFIKDINKNYTILNNKKYQPKGIPTKENFKFFKNSVLEYAKEFDATDLIICTLTIHTNLKEEHITKTERFDKSILEALTGNRVLHIPIQIIFPCGIKIKDLEKIQPLISHKTQGFVDDVYGWFLNILCPHSVPPIHGIDLFWDRNNKKSMSKATKDSLSYDYNMGSFMAIWTIVRQCLIHMSIYGHPEFKEFCVNTLKRKGLQPNKTPYSSERPINIKPSWKPQFEHYMVTVNIPDEVSLEANATSIKKRHHLVRGHLMRSSGKTAKDGYVWRRSHWRGSKKLGTVTKDYTMKIDDRIDKKAI